MSVNGRVKMHCNQKDNIALYMNIFGGNSILFCDLMVIC